MRQASSLSSADSLYEGYSNTMGELDRDSKNVNGSVPALPQRKFMGDSMSLKVLI